MSEKHRYKKLGGWLLIFVISLLLQIAAAVLAQFGEGGLLDVLRGWSLYDGAQAYLLLAGQVVSLLLILIHVFVVAEILQRDPYFLRTLQMAFVVAAINLLVQLAGGYFYGFEGYGLLMLVLQGVVFPFGVLFAMLYYTRSVRVRTYMGSDEYLRLAFLTKKMKGPKPAVPDGEEAA